MHLPLGESVIRPVAEEVQEPSRAPSDTVIIEKLVVARLP